MTTHLPTEDRKDAAIPLTIGNLRRLTLGKPDDWRVEIRVVSDRVILLDVDEEDVAFERGFLMLICGASGDGSVQLGPTPTVEELGLTKEGVEEAMRGVESELGQDLSDAAMPKLPEEGEDGS